MIKTKVFLISHVGQYFSSLSKSRMGKNQSGIIFSIILILFSRGVFKRFIFSFPQHGPAFRQRMPIKFMRMLK